MSTTPTYHLTDLAGNVVSHYLRGPERGQPVEYDEREASEAGLVLARVLGVSIRAVKVREGKA